MDRLGVFREEKLFSPAGNVTSDTPVITTPTTLRRLVETLQKYPCPLIA